MSSRMSSKSAQLPHPYYLPSAHPPHSPSLFPSFPNMQLCIRIHIHVDSSPLLTDAFDAAFEWMSASSSGSCRQREQERERERDSDRGRQTEYADNFSLHIIASHHKLSCLAHMKSKYLWYASFYAFPKLLWPWLICKYWIKLMQKCK